MYLKKGHVFFNSKIFDRGLVADGDTDRLRGCGQGGQSLCDLPETSKFREINFQIKKENSNCLMRLACIIMSRGRALKVGRHCPQCYLQGLGEKLILFTYVAFLLIERAI